MTEQDLIKAGMPPKPGADRVNWLEANGFAILRPGNAREIAICWEWPTIPVVKVRLDLNTHRKVMPTGLLRQLSASLPEGAGSGWPARDGEVAQKVAKGMYRLWKVRDSKWYESGNAIDSSPFKTSGGPTYDVPAEEFQVALVEARLSGSPRASNRG